MSLRKLRVIKHNINSDIIMFVTYLKKKRRRKEPHNRITKFNVDFSNGEEKRAIFHAGEITVDTTSRRYNIIAATGAFVVDLKLTRRWLCLSHAGHA